MFGRNFFGAPSRWAGGGPRLGAIVPIARPHKRMGQLSCCNAPDGKGYCFDTGSGECIMTWVSSATGTPGTPACVRDSRGQWVLPSCVGQEAVESGGRPPLPAGCEYVGAESNAIQEVLCETYNCTTRESGGWRGTLSEFIAMGSRNPGLKSPEWFPKPAVCPNGPGGGGTYTPPAAPQTSAPAPSAPTPAPAPPPAAPPLPPEDAAELPPEDYDTLPGAGGAPPPPTAMPAPSYPPMPGGAVPVMPGPFQGPPPTSQVRMAPAQSAAQRFNQSIRPACRTTPYQKHMFPMTTVPLRPDAFSPASQWVR